MSSLLEQLRESLAPQYKVERELASGGMGAVFLARDVTLDRRVAIKTVKPEVASPDAARRFLREARTLASLSHPNVVPVYTAGEAGGRLYYVMDYVEGETLEARLARGTLSAEEALKLAIDLLGALEAAHERGIVHRDVKPSNVFLVKNRALLGDFGIAKHTEDTSEGLTAPGHRVGTPGYMAPEQVTGDATPRTDLYAVGMVLYEALSGRKWSVLTKTSEVDWSGVPGGLAVVLERALAWSPEDRWEDAAEFRNALLAATGRDESVAESPTGLGAFLSRLRKRRLPRATTRIQPGRPVGARRAESPTAGTAGAAGAAPGSSPTPISAKVDSSTAVPRMIEVTTLGGAAVRRDGIELSALSKHKQKFALLVYLAVEGPVARDQLLAVFWPDKEEEKARHSLSQALYALKRELSPECVKVSGDLISLSTDTIAVDVKRMEEAAARESWGSVVELYRGPFLDPFSLPGSVEFEDWQSRTRTRLARLARRAFAQVIEQLAINDDPQAALAVATRWAALQPLEDEAQHTFIALLARAGRRSDALKHYEAYRDRLARELEVEPLEETAALVERIKRGEMPEFLPLAAPERRKDVPAVRELPTGHYFKTPLGGVLAKAEPAAADGKRGPTALLDELRKRRVLHVGAAYLVVSYLVVKISATFIDRGMLPEWVVPVLLFFLVVGLPFALILAWTQEQQVVGTPVARTVATTGPWPRWFERVRGGHVLAFLSTLVLALLAVLFVLERDIFRPQPPIAVAARFHPTEIAVLYFDDHSEGQQYRHLAAGFTDELITQLGQVDALFVRSLNAVKPYRDADVGVDSIARALKVGSLVEGVIVGSGHQLRVTVRLVDGASGEQLHNKRLQRPVGEVLALLDDVGQEVSRFLRLQLGVEIRLREQMAATESVEAWELVQEAGELRETAEKSEMEGDTVAAAAALDRANSVLAQAESLDSHWIEPIVLRGWVAADGAELFQIAPRSYDPGRLQSGLSHAERALRLDPESPAALELRGTLRYHLWETAEASEAVSLREATEQDFHAAVSADPSRTIAWTGLAKILRVGGRYGEAKIAALAALEADAFLREARTVIYILCHASLELEEFEDAIRWCAEGRQRYPDRASFMALQLLFLAGADGPEADPEEAWRLAEKFVEVSPPHLQRQRRVDALMRVAAVLARAGLADSARAVIRRAREADSKNDPLTSYYEANVWLQLGEREKALNLLRLYLAARPDRKSYIARDWWWRPLRGDPLFKALVDRL